MENATKAEKKADTRTDADHLSRLVEDLGKVVDDFRQLLQEQAGPEKEGGIRNAIHRVRDFVKRKPSEGEGAEQQQAKPPEQQAKPPEQQAKPPEQQAKPPEQQAQAQQQQPAQPAEEQKAQAQPPQQQGPDQQKAGPEETKIADELSKARRVKETLTDLVTGLGHVYEALGGALSDLKNVVEGKLTGEESALRSALTKARHLVGRGAQEPSPPKNARTLKLFDGSDESLERWKLVGSGSFEREGEELRLRAGADRGLVYYAAERFDDLSLRLQFRPDSPDFEMSTAIRFRDPEQPVPDRDDPSIVYPYDNQAFIAIHTGFEVVMGGQRPGVEPGVIDGVLLGDAGGAQTHAERAEVKPNDWNDLEITVEGDQYSVRLNGKRTAQFANSDTFRGKTASADPQAGFIGFVLRNGSVALRHLEIETQPIEERRGEAGEPAAQAEQG